MVSPKVMAQTVEMLFKLKDAKALEDVIAGNPTVIKELLGTTTKGTISKKDIETFSSMAEACARAGTGETGKSIKPASLVRILTGGGWTIALAAAGAIAKNAGETIAKMQENKANALAEGFLTTRDWASDKQREFYGKSPRVRAGEAVANYERTKALNRAEAIRGFTKALSDAIGAGTGVYQMGKMIEAGREFPVGAEVLRTARAAANMAKGGK